MAQKAHDVYYLSLYGKVCQPLCYGIFVTVNQWVQGNQPAHCFKISFLLSQISAQKKGVEGALKGEKLMLFLSYVMMASQLFLSNEVLIGKIT